MLKFSSQKVDRKKCDFILPLFYSFFFHNIFFYVRLSRILGDTIYGVHCFEFFFSLSTKITNICCVLFTLMLYLTVMFILTDSWPYNSCPRFPVQFSIEVIKTRLANNYYRTLEAVRHDTTVMLSNAESYFSKISEMTKKIRKLSEWVDQIFSSL